MNSQVRLFFFLASMLLWIGIALTGIETIHWLLYLPAFFFLFTALTGICPGMIFIKKVFLVAEDIEPKKQLQDD